MKRILLVGVLVLGWVGGAVPASSTTTQSPGLVQLPAVATSPATAQDSSAEFPPGLSEEGVTDALALARAHQQTLENTSYVMSTVSAYQRPNGTVLNQGTTVERVAPGAESYYATTSQVGRNATRPLNVGHYDIEVWANETDAVTARNLPESETTYRRTTRSDAPMEPDTQWELLYAAFDTANASVVERVERNGTTLFKVVSTSRSDSASAYAEDSQYDFVALVDAQGVVRSLQMTHRSTLGDRPVVVSRTLRVTEIGNTTVERPSWYRRAVEDSIT